MSQLRVPALALEDVLYNAQISADAENTTMTVFRAPSGRFGFSEHDNFHAAIQAGTGAEFIQQVSP